MKKLTAILLLLAFNLSYGQKHLKDYDCVDQYAEGYAKVRKNDKNGYIDITGKLVIPLIYDDALCFSEGRAAVSIKGKWGFIDSTGKEVIPMKFYEVYSFHEGMAAVNESKFGFIDKDGKYVN